MHKHNVPKIIPSLCPKYQFYLLLFTKKLQKSFESYKSKFGLFKNIVNQWEKPKLAL